MNNRKSRKIQLSDGKICLILYLISFLMMAVMGSVLSISYIYDETGTVANAAYLAGYNWNDWVNSTGGYFYKYGQALFYFPIFKLVSNPYLIYKLMLLVNAVFVAWIPVISYKILRRHLHEENKVKCAGMSFCLAVIPATVLYSLYARADVMLISFAWIILYLLFETFEEESPKRRLLFSSLIAFLSVYMYMCHSRGIVFLIAIFIIVCIVRFILKDRGINFLAYLINLVFWIFVDNKLTHFFKSNIWGSGNKKNTFENVNVDKYSNLFTAEGMETLLKNITGWLFNSFLGTFGFVLLGIVFSVVGIVYFVSKKENISKKEAVLFLYALLVYFGTLAMSALFSFGSNYKFVTGVSVKRADRFLYSRYEAPIYAVLVFIALYYLFFKTDCFGWKTKLVTLFVGGGLIIYCRTWLSGFVNEVEYSWRNTIDSALLFGGVRYGNDANKYKGISRALLLTAVLAFCVLLVCIIISQLKIQYKSAVLVCIAGCFLFSTVINYKKLRFSTDIRPMMMVGSVITQMYEIEEDTDISQVYGDVYVDKSVTRYKMLQLAMPEFVVHVKRSMKAEDVNNMFILAKNYIIRDEWAGDDCYLFADYEMENTQTTVIVKGDALKEELEHRGVELIPIPEDYTERTIEKREMWLRVKQVFGYQWDSFFR